ncbi:uncharacterized protein LOC111050544 [Nilaparvata lugens]|uniref:uncharacterized protein LOC111050544 n=1 Tax=Nilaparvata lugens TaxID=108931 RepID=UPI00193C8BE3|nr:uncharacterized protein LOC111050544 [Nilaparvata lugens]
MLTSVFHVVRGIEEVIRCVVVLKRTKGDHNGDHHNYVVDLLSRVCAIDRQVRDCVIEKIELLMKSASSDEEDIWCLSLLIQYLCEKNRDMCFKLVKMLVRLFSLEIESHVKKSEHWEVQSVYSFCILNTIKTVVRFLKNQLENATEKDNYSTLDRFMTLKSDLAKSFTQLEANQNQQESPSLNFSNHNLCLISYIFQDILKHTQDCISLIEERALS